MSDELTQFLMESLRELCLVSVVRSIHFWAESLPENPSKYRYLYHFSITVSPAHFTSFLLSECLSCWILRLMCRRLTAFDELPDELVQLIVKQLSASKQCYGRNLALFFNTERRNLS